MAIISNTEATSPTSPTSPTSVVTREQHPPLSTGRIFIYVVLILGACASVLPFVYMIMTSFKSYGSVINNTFWPWPPFGGELPQFQNYAEAVKTIGWDRQWNMPLVLRYFANSSIVAAAIIIGTLLTAIPAAYALARMNLPGKGLILIIILATVMVPPDLTLVPKVVLMYNLHWYNRYPALIVPFITSVFAIFLLRQFFMQIPSELFDAAVIDGAGHMRYLTSVVVPLSKPAILTVTLLQFIWSWDSFKWPLLVTKDSSMRVLAVGLQQFSQGEGGTNTQLLMAFASLVVLPVVVLYFFTQKHFTQGIITTGIKG